MREIKFRYLHKGEWFFVDMYKNNTQLKLEEYESKNKTSPFLEFTGLTDDDGKELYEGDIVSNEVAKWEVIFNKGCFCGKHIDGKTDGTQETHLALRAIRGKKLIGNIYIK